MNNTPQTQKSPYLQNQRNFPKDPNELSKENDLTYIDIASKVNCRTIGTFALDSQIVTGEQWYLKGSSQKQQTLRQIYTFITAGTIAHGIDIESISGFTRIYGTFTDSDKWYPLPYVNVVAVTNQVSVIVNSSQIVISAGAGAPVITSGTVVLEWLSLH